MRINGNVEDINIINLIHKGKDIKFKCFSRPMPYMPRVDLEPPKEATIAFDDLKEVDEMIEMLKRFKIECAGYMGNWGKDK